MNKNPLVSVVLLNWNGLKYIKDCLLSLQKQTYSNIEVIIVDNNSKDNSITIAKEMMPNALFIINKVNVGFAEGMNIGIQACQGDFVLLLNNDVYLHEKYIETCASFLLANNKAGCCAGSEYLWKDGILTNERVSFGPYYIKKRFQLKEEAESEDIAIGFGVSGSFPVFRKEAITDLISVSKHFFDKSFETGWEDTDIRFRLFYRGWETYYLSQAIAWHAGSGSVGEKKTLVSKSFNYQVRIFRNRRFVINKNLFAEHAQWRIYLNFLEGFIFFFYLIRSPKSAAALIAGNFKAFQLRNEIKAKKLLIRGNVLIDLNELNRFVK